MAQTPKHEVYKPVYQFPSYLKNPKLDYLTITDEQLSEWEKEVSECNKYNTDEWDKYLAQYTQARDALLVFFGEHSNEYKYISAKRPYSGGKPYLSLIELKRSVVDARGKKREADRVAYQEAKKGRAVEWLIKRGKTYAVDFTLDNAISIADDIAADEVITKKIAEMTENPQFISFNGDNCDEERNCSGWDGHSYRCDCGNRRVNWTTGSGFSFENTDDIEAEAW